MQLSNWSCGVVAMHAPRSNLASLAGQQRMHAANTFVRPLPAGLGSATRPTADVVCTPAVQQQVSGCTAKAVLGCRAARLACRATGDSSSSEDTPSYSQPAPQASAADYEQPPQQQSPQQGGEQSEGSSPQGNPEQQHESAQSDPQAGAQQQQQQPSEQQLLRIAMQKLQALETYQQLMSDSSSSSSSAGQSDEQLQRQAGDTPSQVSAKIAADKDHIPLLDAAILIAQHKYPDLDPVNVKQQLDDLAAEVEAGLPAGSRYPLRVMKEINRVLYQVHGFKGNSEDYYHPDNSCINRVLETNQGIPISLSLVYMEVAARVGLPMAGVNLPAHFMIRPQVDGIEWLVDAFNGGELTALEDAEEVLGKLMGAQVKLDPRFVSGDTPPLSCRAFLLRLLNNLKQIYITLNMAEEALAIVRYMRATAPAGSLPELQRDEGLCLYGLGRWPEATDALQGFMASSPDPRDAVLVETLLDKIKERAAAAAAAAAAAGRGGSSSSVDDDTLTDYR